MGSDPKTAPLQFRAAIALSACQRGDHLHQILMSIAGLIQKEANAHGKSIINQGIG